MNDHRSGTPINQPKSIFKKSIEIKFKDFVEALGKASIDAFFGNWNSVATDAVEILSTLGLSTGSTEKGWLLVYRSLLQAMKNLIEEKTELELEKFDIKLLQA